jgi:hypothetical protein
MDIAELIWNQLQVDLQNVRDAVDVTTTRTERSETAGGVRACLYAELPNAAGGAAAGDLFFCTNARKIGEAAGAGTGTIVYYNSPTDTWYRVADDSAVVI